MGAPGYGAAGTWECSGVLWRGAVRFLDPCRQLSELSCGELFLLYKRADYLNLIRHVGRLLDGLEVSRPFDLEDDGDLLALVREVIDHGEGEGRRGRV